MSAACAGIDPKVFFEDAWDDTTNKERKGAEAAKAICQSCPLRDHCLDLSIELNEMQYGIWGGLNPRERRVIKLKRKFYEGEK